MQHLVHSDDVPPERQAVEGSDIDALWQDLGRASGSVDVGLNRLRFEPGKRPTPAHDHGAEEEIFYVLAGSGLSWRAGETHEVGAGRLPRLPARARRAHADRGRRSRWTCSRSASAGRPRSAICRARR